MKKAVLNWISMLIYRKKCCELNYAFDFSYNLVITFCVLNYFKINLNIKHIMLEYQSKRKNAQRVMQWILALTFPWQKIINSLGNINKNLPWVFLIDLLLEYIH